MRRNRPAALGVLLACGLALASAAVAQPPQAAAARKDLRAAEQARAAGQAAQREAARRAERAAATERRLAQDHIATVAQLRAAEDATARVAARLEQLASEQDAAEARLQTRAADLAPLLPLIQRLSLHPAETLLAIQSDQSAGQSAALRGTLVLRILATRLEAEAVGLRAEQAVLEATRRAVAAEQPRLRAARAAQVARGAILDRQIEAAQASRHAALDAAEQAAREAAEQAARADSLRAMIAELETQRRAAEDRARAHTSRARRAAARQAARAGLPGANLSGAHLSTMGSLVVPVAGSLTRDWGAPTEAGPASGLTWRPAPGARVLAPCAGKIMFAAPFRTFGLLLILDCGGGHHVVLAGLERIDAQIGRTARAGEPVGAMANWEPGTPGPRPALYLELRQAGRPVNPTPWLHAHG